MILKPESAKHSVWSDLSPRLMLQPHWQHCASWPHRVGAFVVHVAAMNGAVIPLLFVSVAASEISGIDLRTSDAAVPFAVFAGLAVTAIPLVEEALFRWPGVQQPQLWQCVPAVVSAAVALSGLLSGAHLGVQLSSDVAVLSIGVGLYFLARRVVSLSEIEQRAHRIWERWPVAPICLLVVAFAMAHLSRFDIDWTLQRVAALPLVVSPWIWAGGVLTLSRIRFGWWQTVALHAVSNLITIWVIAT